MSANLQRITGQFPFPPGSPAAPVAFLDSITNGYGWSYGCQSIVVITAQPTITKPWTILGWSITYSMWLSLQAFGQLSGVFGKLSGGLILGGTVTPQTVAPFQMSSLPSDPTTIAPLWDGATDTTPQWEANKTIKAPANSSTVSLQLPVPLLMAPSDKMGMGLWLTPSLGAPVNDGGAFQISGVANYAIQYTTDG